MAEMLRIQRCELGNKLDIQTVKPLGEVDQCNGNVEDETQPQHRTARATEVTAVNNHNEKYDSNNTLY